MTQLAFIADDFGMSPEINAAIATAHHAGALHGASLMVDQEHTDGAVSMVRGLDKPLAVGLHLNFSDKRDLGDRWKVFPWKMELFATHRASRRGEFAGRFVAETRAQFEAYRETGLPLAFVNGHHHLHIQPVVFNEVRRCLQDLFPEFDGWVRLGEARWFGHPAFVSATLARIAMTRDPEWDGLQTTHVWGPRNVFETRAKDVIRSVAGLREGFHEFYFHPGADKSKGGDPALGDAGQNRAIDLQALLDPRIVNLAVSHPIR